MTFKLKVLVASLALVVALPASAAMDNSLAVGNSSLVLTLWNSVNQTSATFDLGVTKSTFDSASAQTFSLKGTDQIAAWNSFFSTGSLSDVKYGVFAGDTTGDPSQASFLTTGANAWSDIMNQDVISIASKFDDYILDNNNNSTHYSAANGASFVSNPAANAYAGFVYNVDGGIADLGFDMIGNASSNLYLWSITAPTGNVDNYGTAAANKVGGAYFSLNTVDGVLSYSLASLAPVPEADTSAMMLAGIGLMGFIARRRKSV